MEIKDNQEVGLDDLPGVVVPSVGSPPALREVPRGVLCDQLTVG